MTGAAGLAACAGFGRLKTAAAQGRRTPNFVIIYCDDMGYGDIGCFGSTRHRTPNIDRMAAEGTRFTSFYVTSGVCTPSRSSLMTACYPRRTNMHVDAEGRWVLFPVSKKGLDPNEKTIAEVLKEKRYATACVGKWHLGDQPEFLPTKQGFDSYYGVPYSNDMHYRRGGSNSPELPLMRNATVIEAPADQNTLTARYTREAVAFIAKNQDRPFFLYLPHTMPHLPVHASDRFRGRSANAIYGDAIEEIDWSTGRILAALKELGLDDNTLVVFTSDNGAANRPPNGGSNAPLSGFKGSTMEGGMRVPCVMRWPGKIPKGSACGEVASTMDLLPTFARLAGTNAPRDRIVDGKDIWPLMAGAPGAKSPHAAFYYYFTEQLQAVRSGKWKLHLALEEKTVANGRKVSAREARLIDLDADIGETTDLSAEHPKVVARLNALAERAREDLGDAGRAGKNQRPAGMNPNPQPLLMG